MLNVVTLDDKTKWNEIIRSMNNFDFYHLAEYHQLDDSGNPLLLYYSEKEDSFALPVILRAIADSSYCDVTSVYGYAGPLSKRENPDEKTVNSFQSALKEYFKENKVVTAFARLHPLITEQNAILTGMGDILEENLTVGIDLTLPETQQRKQYAHNVKYQINRLNRMKVEVKKASRDEEIDAFIAMYEENMKRVNASALYFFSRDYFYNFLKKTDSEIFLASYENEWIAGSLCTYCNGFMQTHLNATKNAFLHLSPLKLIIDYARKDGIARDMKILHLGGGRGGANDSLFLFKSWFSDLHFTFRTWRYVYDKEAFEKLIYNKFGENIPKLAFFPLYRA